MLVGIKGFEGALSVCASRREGCSQGAAHLCFPPHVTAIAWVQPQHLWGQGGTVRLKVEESLCQQWGAVSQLASHSSVQVSRRLGSLPSWFPMGKLSSLLAEGK